MRLLLILASVILPFTAPAKPSKIPPDSEVLSELGKKDPAIKLSNHVNLMVWNMLKGERDGWQQEYAEASSGANLILLQEGMLDPAMRTGLLARTDFLYTFTASFFWGDYLTGIYTGAPALPIDRKFFRSVDREPFTNTPKMGLRMDYVLASGKVLRVINVHALNFTEDEAHARQISELVEELRAHDGPLIFAGDFNIYNDTRWENLERSTAAIGLREVRVNAKLPVQNLDHIFVRGCEVRGARERDTTTSDHSMLFAELDCE